MATEDAILQIIYTGNSRGLLEPCGCGMEKKGGFGRRLAFLESCRTLDISTKPRLVSGNPSHFRNRVRDDLLLADTGSFLDLNDPVRAANAGIVFELMREAGYQVLNLGVGEISGPTGSIDEFLRACQLTLVSANITVTASHEHLSDSVKQYSLMNVAGHKVAVTGVAIDSPARRANAEVFSIAEPVKAVRELTSDPALRDVILVLMVDGLPPSQIQQLKQLPGVDCILSSVYTTPVDGCYVAVPVAPGGTDVNLVVVEMANCCVTQGFSCSFELGEELPEDPAAAKIIAQSIRLQDIPGSDGNGTDLAYAGNSECIHCHQNEYESWSETPHAVALVSLERANEEGNALCLQCHTVGALYYTGFLDVPAKDKRFVGCESCHGPGSVHVSRMLSGKQKQGAGALVIGPADMCPLCHNETNSPAFKLEEALTRLAHP